MMLEYLQRLAWSPTTPVPPGWPHGWYGVLLLFCVPGGIGIPPGVLLGHHDGLGPIVMTLLYFVSDVALACVFEPVLRMLAGLARVVPAFGRAAAALLVAIDRVMPGGGGVGPVSVVLVGLGLGLPFGRAIAAAAGFALVPGWLLAIAGDMLCFGIGMTSTLWFGGMLGDQRLAALAGLGVMVAVPFAVRHLRQRLG